MSSRDESNVWPFKKINTQYDLNQNNDEYWRRFENFLQQTYKRDIIVQIEIWATFDYYRDNWQLNPFNPKNNINYTAQQTHLPEQVSSHPVYCENNFFWSVPAERNQKTVLKYQRRFVDKILAHSLKFGHILYCMNNETSVTPNWGKYWSQYVKNKAKKLGRTVHTTEMFKRQDMEAGIDNRYHDPVSYSFIDISQNNHQTGQTHSDNALRQRSFTAGHVCPINNVKVYGADTGRFGNDRDGIERFWRNIFAGAASARFHRPVSGLGLGKKAQANIRSTRMLTDRINIFACAPRNDLLSDRSQNEAYCIANPTTEYAVYFPDGGQVTLDVSSRNSGASVQWLDIMNCKWLSTQKVQSGSRLKLHCPSKGHWAVLVKQPSRPQK